MDTVTLIRSAIRGVLKVAGAELGAQLRAVIRREDDYATAGKPVCDYEDGAGRKQLLDARPRTTQRYWRCWMVALDLAATQAGVLLATVLGQGGRRGLHDRLPGR